MPLVKLSENPEIYNIKIPLPKNALRDLNVYVIVSQGEALFIDTGFRKEECRIPLLEGIEQLGIPWEKIKLFVTHMHSDHAGQTDIFSSHGCPVYMNEVDFPWLERTLTGMGRRYISERLLKNGFPQEEIDLANRTNPMYAFAPRDIMKFEFVHDGDVLKVGDINVKVIQTSGHTPGHSCLYLEDDKILFSGDHILYDISPNITMWTDVKDSLGNYIASLNKVDKLPFVTAYPAHRELHDHPHDRIQALLAHHRDRLNEALAIIKAHPGSTGYETASKMKWSIHGTGWHDYPVSQKWFAVAEALAHLDWLEIRGFIRFEEVDGIKHVFLVKDEPVRELD